MQTSHLSLASQQKQRVMRSEDDWTIINDLKKSSAADYGDLERAMRKFIGSKISFKDILMYLEFERPKYFEAFRVPGECGSRVGDGSKAVDPDDLLNRWSKGLDASQFKDEPNVLGAANIWNLPLDARHDLMENWESEIRKMILEEICTLGKNYNDCQDQLSLKLSEATVAALGGKRIIACTMTGAAKFSQDIRAAKPMSFSSRRLVKFLKATSSLR